MWETNMGYDDQVGLVPSMEPWEQSQASVSSWAYNLFL